MKERSTGCVAWPTKQSKKKPCFHPDAAVMIPEEGSGKRREKVEARNGGRRNHSLAKLDVALLHALQALIKITG